MLNFQTDLQNDTPLACFEQWVIFSFTSNHSLFPSITYFSALSVLDCGNLPLYVCVYQRGYCRYWWVLKLLAIDQAKSDDTNSIGIRNVCVFCFQRPCRWSMCRTCWQYRCPKSPTSMMIVTFSSFGEWSLVWWVCSAVFKATRSVFVRVFSLAQRVWQTAVFVHVQCRKLDKWLLKHCPSMFSHVLLL